MFHLFLLIKYFKEYMFLALGVLMNQQSPGLPFFRIEVYIGELITYSRWNLSRAIV